MARKAKLKKGDQVSYQGRTMFLAKDQYLFRNKPVVDIESRSGITGANRISINEIETPVKSDPEPADTACSIAEQVTDTYLAQLTADDNADKVSINKYQRQIINAVGESIIVDVYDVLDAFNVTDAAVAHAIKKLLAPGQRGTKTVVQDLQESIASVERAIDRQHSKHLRG